MAISTQTAAALLDKLLARTKGQVRSTKLLTDFEEGTTRGWFLSVPLAFRRALDWRIDTRRRKGDTYKVPTQGATFEFATGDVLYDQRPPRMDPAASPHSTEGPPQPLAMVQVVEAEAATPCEGGRAGVPSTPRHPGKVVFNLYTCEDTDAGFEKRCTVHTTQDDFLRFAILGPPAEWPDVVAACAKVELHRLV